MISRIGKFQNKGRQAFTLIELIVVLGLIATILGVAAPSLSRFFAGRALKEETRRLLALTQYGSNQAINEGVPMILWIEEKEGEYGLRPDSGYPTNRYNTFHYHLHDNLQFDIENNELNSLNTTTTPSISFLPDGSISETSLYSVKLKDRREGESRIAQTYSRLNYEVRREKDDPEYQERP
ncbi:prepilin-type N-terminal cleavage/methylation domain-containing protein [bacterium]|jgi:prepilin-type N-terminal cleavage/methylation domain-containing protein|nr:prepilin-type N-terminal cleavage/methylation domain-containing protein [Verrucomicrobiota bacterium]MDA7645131.1 prepilin-type N-terminal cleavage/methylation domain-containing protein [bacterium]